MNLVNLVNHYTNQHVLNIYKKQSGQTLSLKTCYIQYLGAMLGVWAVVRRRMKLNEIEQLKTLNWMCCGRSMMRVLVVRAWQSAGGAPLRWRGCVSKTEVTKRSISWSE